MIWDHLQVSFSLNSGCGNEILCLPTDVSIDDLNFSPTGVDGLEVALIEGKGNPFTESSTFAAKAASGYIGPLHSHTHQYEAAIWKGKFQHYIPDVDEDRSNLKKFNPGDAYSIPAGQVHQDINPSQTEPVILLIYFHGPFDIVPENTKPK